MSVNPLSGLLACTVVGLAALLARDAVTPVLLLVPALAWLLSGLPVATSARRSVPVFVAAAGVGFSTALLAPGAGLVWDRGLAMALRVLAVALPGALYAGLVDPTELADALVQRLHAPARFAYGALAALRLLPLLQEEWRMSGLARRARGLGDRRSPAAVVRAFAARCFALLVAAVRRSTRLATAMDARGFDSGRPRTSARTSPLGSPDLVLVSASLVVAVGATLLSAALGTWSPAWG
ncbi:energy-coupling factor transport system permease protein [Motilibacter peucedani]|uniref:Energy-coupling factor transport system permease protein n=1 Tax=Motilibacter peucedani TaxID=598650 RepID=A0A420XMH6_9ACTN|nr:energy-coupling factor transporter transmembrane component T [Motilibacter peucedani]RKS72472.1 energy-coupling factor transport system permease protein [Motilibacter peucedani]